MLTSTHEALVDQRKNESPVLLVASTRQPLCHEEDDAELSVAFRASTVGMHCQNLYAKPDVLMHSHLHLPWQP